MTCRSTNQFQWLSTMGFMLRMRYENTRNMKSTFVHPWKSLSASLMTIMPQQNYCTDTHKSDEVHHVCHNGAMMFWTMLFAFNHCPSGLSASIPFIHSLQHTIIGVQYRYFQYAYSLHWDCPKRTPSLLAWNNILFWMTVELRHSSKTMHLCTPRLYSFKQGDATFWHWINKVFCTPKIAFANCVLPKHDGPVSTKNLKRA